MLSRVSLPFISSLLHWCLCYTFPIFTSCYYFGVCIDTGSKHAFVKIISEQIVRNSSPVFFFSFLDNHLGACISLLMLRLNVKDAYCKTIISIIILSILNFKYFFVLRYKRSNFGLRDLKSNMKETGDIARAYQDYISPTVSTLEGKFKIRYNYNVRHGFQFWTNVDVDFLKIDCTF